MDGLPPTGVERFPLGRVNISIPQSGDRMQRPSLTWSQVVYLRSRLDQLEVANSGGYPYPSGGLLAKVYGIEVKAHGDEVVIQSQEQSVDVSPDHVAVLHEGLSKLMSLVRVPPQASDTMDA